MNARIQKLCKRLNRFTLEEIALIAELEESEVKIILQDLIKENLLIVHDNNYIYNNIEKEIKLKKRLPLMFQFHTSEEIDMIIKCFCAGVTTDKGAFLLGISDATLQKFNMYFREIIYEKQLQELKEYFEQSQNIAKVRTFYNVPVCFYLYENKLFASEKKLKSRDLKEHSKQEKLRIKVLYSRLRRSINHSKMKKLMHYHVAEHLWKYGKDFPPLKEELKSLLFD